MVNKLRVLLHHLHLLLPLLALTGEVIGPVSPQSLHTLVYLLVLVLGHLLEMLLALLIPLKRPPPLFLSQHIQIRIVNRALKLAFSLTAPKVTQSALSLVHLINVTLHFSVLVFLDTLLTLQEPEHVVKLASLAVQAELGEGAVKDGGNLTEIIHGTPANCATWAGLVGFEIEVSIVIIWHYRQNGE